MKDTKIPKQLIFVIVFEFLLSGIVFFTFSVIHNYFNDVLTGPGSDAMSGYTVLFGGPIVLFAYIILLLALAIQILTIIFSLKSLILRNSRTYKVSSIFGYLGSGFDLFAIIALSITVILILDDGMYRQTYNNVLLIVMIIGWIILLIKTVITIISSVLLMKRAIQLNRTAKMSQTNTIVQN